ncbi:MAG: hypothetical protein AAGA96_07220 [Verrucomicrobiota bacterium]
MQAIYEYLYHPGVPLKLMGIVLGAGILLSHLWGLFQPKQAKAFLKGFPRNEKIGIPLVIFCFAWGLMIWTCMDLGEFFKIERQVQFVIVGVCIGVVILVREFIAVRALGFFLILLAAPILDSAFLQEPKTRLLIVAYAYVIALKGMFWVGMPYLLRDQINWILAKDSRYHAGVIAGSVFGAVVLLCALLFW